MAEQLARITEVHDLGMIALRGDLDAIAAALGMAAPDRTSIATEGDRMLGWMSPDEALLILPAASRAADLSRLTEALADRHALVADVSDARAVFDVIGPHADDVIAKLAPIDAGTMPAGHLRRTRLAQVAAAIWRIEGGFRVIGFRSVADYMRLVLANAAIPGSGLGPR
ncbi:sarcosine oxidase subunit gamma family protein [Paracoccus sp. 1_MG-2023]|uniref:sarcosine oxidase subunit gamma n=1 Tax=unclassified Paracoccus (in: a-proteobacteria) TaxID=2688777 RepID=UPI001C0A4FC7|nr:MULTISPECIES: sarcosine oxidase subunit gamma family protein [unclassified Paracoccus (in: a-proteobacteria)]MBU2957085.1 sarcosine oxidase subunit gamma [Paracoccus sp. C2R09]MDO6669581.1 sarcosine oxidase subunit gamma family protein [Paracoccus sp. 1_MG-2023]